MALEIQQSVNSIMGSVNQIRANDEENIRKAVKIVAGAAKGFATGGPVGAIAGGVGAASEIAGTPQVGQAAQQFVQGYSSPQQQAAAVAQQSMENAQEQKVAQQQAVKQRVSTLQAVQGHEIRMGSESRKVGDMPPEFQKKYVASLSNSQKRAARDAFRKETTNG